jgi:hypothetical protein
MLDYFGAQMNGSTIGEILTHWAESTLLKKSIYGFRGSGHKDEQLNDLLVFVIQLKSTIQ